MKITNKSRGHNVSLSKEVKKNIKLDTPSCFEGVRSYNHIILEILIMNTTLWIKAFLLTTMILSVVSFMHTLNMDEQAYYTLFRDVAFLAPSAKVLMIFSGFSTSICFLMMVFFDNTVENDFKKVNNENI